MNPLLFLVDILLQLYATALLIRVLLQWVGADFYNPVSQFIVKITNPPVLPARKLIPGFWGIDMATLLLCLLTLALKVIIVYQTLNPLAISLLAIGQALMLTLSVFLYAIIIQAILSWVNPDPHNPAVNLLNSLTYPILRHCRNLLPSMGGIDLSPMIAIIALMFIQYSVRYLFMTLFGINL